MFEFLRQRARNKFVQQVMEALAARGRTDFVYDAESFSLKSPHAVANLGNVFSAWQQARGPHQQQIFDNFIGAFYPPQAAEPPPWDEARDKLVAVIRERSYYAFAAAQFWGLAGANPKDATPAHEPCSDWFARGLVIDFPTHAMIVNESTLTHWNITFDEAFALGLEKLRNSTTPKFEREHGVFVGKWNDDYDSSRLLIPEIFRDLPLAGDPVVTIPNRLTLLVAGSDDHAAVRTMLARAEETVRTIPKPQNPAPLVLRNGEFVDFKVDPSSPLYNDVQRARYLTALGTYTEQKAILEETYQKQGKDLFVTNYTLAESDKGYFAYAVWTKGVAALLPTAENVMFMDLSLPEGRQLVAQASWEKTCAVLGDLMLDTKMFPPRHYVSQFPSAAQLQALGMTE